jgi:uroporphyrinogen III methyltransferase/synthase
VDTLVFLMAVENIANVTEALIKNGRSPDTPVAAVRRGTRKDQTTIVGTLGTIEEQMRTENIKPPAVVIVGEVVRLRDKLKWFEKTRGRISERKVSDLLSGVS